MDVDSLYFLRNSDIKNRALGAVFICREKLLQFLRLHERIKLSFRETEP
jgi:hypothetical protein